MNWCEEGFRRREWLKQVSRPGMHRLEEPVPLRAPPPVPRPQARAEGKRVPVLRVGEVEDGVG